MVRTWLRRSGINTHLIGVIGVSGRTGEQDKLCAQTALNALQGEL
ncbi:hypothetical protein E2R56_11315 [Rhodococcus qingshengii]|nr:hypothetical protein E2R56_11315 [Rhodococcus qingshengii]